jgi:hypothetical protein
LCAALDPGATAHWLPHSMQAFPSLYQREIRVCSLN